MVNRMASLPLISPQRADRPYFSPPHPPPRPSSLKLNHPKVRTDKEAKRVGFPYGLMACALPDQEPLCPWVLPLGQTQESWQRFSVDIRISPRYIYAKICSKDG